jgi:hypothetical protein
MLNITRKVLCWPGMDPIPRTNHREEHRAMAQAEQSPQHHNARLSMLILSKAYPFHGILSHVTIL